MNSRYFFGICLTLGITTQLSIAADFESDMDAFVAHVVEAEFTPGMAICVVQNGKPLYVRGHGFADRETERPVDQATVFYIASSTKSFTGLLAAILAEKNEIDLDAKLSELLPNAAWHADIDPATITLRQLLTHTHGITNDGPVTFRSAYSGQHSHELGKRSHLTQLSELFLEILKGEILLDHLFCQLLGFLNIRFLFRLFDQA